MAVSTKNMNLDKIVKKNNTPLAGLLGNVATPEEVKIIEETAGTEKELPVEKLQEFQRHTFNVRDDQDMENLVTSIKDSGILIPILVREKDGKYEIISGHRRVFAARKIGLEKVPCKIIDVDDDTANIMMVDTNITRSTISISEKVHSYYIKHESLKHQGKKIKDNIGVTTAQMISNTVSDSATTIKRYIKLNDLIDPLLNRMDNGEIGFIPGVSISFLSKDAQRILEGFLSNNKFKITGKIAEAIREAYEQGSFDEDFLKELKNNSKKAKNVKEIIFTEKMIEDVVPKEILDKPFDERIQIYRAALEEYFK